MSEKKDTDFMPEYEAALNTKPERGTTFLLLAIAGLIAWFIAWASYAEIEEVTRGGGQVMASSEVQILQSLEGGILQELLIAEGDTVKKGQTLARISDIAFSSEKKGRQAQFLSQTIRKARLTAEIEDKPFTLSEKIRVQAAAIAANEEALYNSRQQELKNARSILDGRISQSQSALREVSAQINRLSQNRKLLKEELSMTKKMVAQNAVPKLEEIRLQRELNDTAGNLNASVQRKRGLESELQTARKEREDHMTRFRTKALAEMNETETQLASLKENLKSIGDRVDRAELKSPANGIVQSIAVKTIGGIIEPAMHLVEIIPVEDDLKIKARVPPADIAFIRHGLPVRVKITAYDSSRYGALDGTLERISPASVTDEKGNIFFEIEVRTKKTYLGSEANPLEISPGMVAEVEVITGKRTILSYLLNPILRASKRALRER